MPEVFATARDVEAAIQEGDQARISKELEKLDQTVKRVIETVSRVLEGEPAPAQPAVVTTRPLLEPAQLTPLLAELDHLLKRNSLTARKHFGLLREQLSSADVHPSMEHLDACLGRLEFKQARMHLAFIAAKLNVKLVPEE